MRVYTIPAQPGCSRYSFLCAVLVLLSVRPLLWCGVPVFNCGHLFGCLLLQLPFVCWREGFTTAHAEVNCAVHTGRKWGPGESSTFYSSDNRALIRAFAPKSQAIFAPAVWTQNLSPITVPRFTVRVERSRVLQSTACSSEKKKKSYILLVSGIWKNMLEIIWNLRQVFPIFGSI